LFVYLFAVVFLFFCMQNMICHFLRQSICISVGHSFHEAQQD
jgi:hypothetical protein